MVVQNLNEAYASIYAPCEITEEVQIAAHYFDSLGLNEDGVEYVIEHLGLEDFVDFVCDIAEEYQLTEARRGLGGTEEKIEPRLSSGKPIEGKPKASSLKALRKKKAARQEAEERASEEKPSGMTAALRRQDAMVAASKRQPPKPGTLDRIAGVINRGIDRHNAANKKWAPVFQGLGQAAGKLGRGLAIAAKGAVSEDFENWVYDLMNEGYDLSDYTWDDMAEIYMENVESLEEARRADREGYERGTAANPNIQDVPYSDPSQRTMLHSRLRRRADEMGRERRNSARYRQGGRPPVSKKEKAFLQASDRTSPGRGHVRNPNVPDTGSHAEWPSQRRDQRDPKKNPKHNANKENAAESYDLYDYMMNYLISEGYADTPESAVVIMSNMSEEWIDTVLDERVKVQAAPIRVSHLRPGQSLFSDAELTNHQTPEELAAARERRNRRGKMKMPEIR